MRAGTNPWPFVRIAALCIVILVMGLAGLAPGVRTAGGMLVVFAGLQLVRRYRRTQAACEVSGQLSVAPAVLLAAAQAGIGLVLLFWPGVLLRLLGV